MLNTKGQAMLLPTILALLLLFFEVFAPYTLVTFLGGTEREEVLSVAEATSNLEAQAQILSYLQSTINTEEGEVRVSDLVSKSIEDESYKPFVKQALTYMATQYNLRTGKTYAPALTYPDGSVMETSFNYAWIFGEDPVAEYTYITYNGEPIVFEIFEIPLSHERQLRTHEPGDMFNKYGKWWVAWGESGIVSYYAELGCPCAFKLDDGKTICEDGRDVEGRGGDFIVAESFSYITARNYECSVELQAPTLAFTPDTSGTEEEGTETAFEDFLEFSERIEEVWKDKEIGALITDPHGRIWQYWGRYDSVLGNPGNEPLKNVLYFLQGSTCDCTYRDDYPCPDTCKPVESGLPGGYHYLMCEGDDEYIPKSVTRNSQKCFKNYYQMQDELQ